MTKEHLLRPGLEGYAHSFIVLVDRTALSMPDFPSLIVGLSEEPGRQFRTIPSEIYAIEANLRPANLSFYEFADNVDEDGVFRGFSWFPLRGIWPGG